MDFGVGKAIDLERIVLSNQKKIERLLRMGSNDSEIARLTEEIAALERRVREADEALRQGEIQSKKNAALLEAAVRLGEAENFPHDEFDEFLAKHEEQGVLP